MGWEEYVFFLFMIDEVTRENSTKENREREWRDRTHAEFLSFCTTAPPHLLPSPGISMYVHFQEISALIPSGVTIPQRG